MLAEFFRHEPVHLIETTTSMTRHKQRNDLIDRVFHRHACYLWVGERDAVRTRGKMVSVDNSSVMDEAPRSSARSDECDTGCSAVFRIGFAFALAMAEGTR